jgi:disulfide bond formation protein DsbB
MMRSLDALAVTGIAGILAFAFGWQAAFHELPCPLCLLQRAAFAMAGLALSLNLLFFASPVHYGMAIVSALAGAAAAMRQILLHIGPGDPGYGSPFLGLHFYTWAFIAFVAIIAWCALMLMLWRWWERPPAGGLARLAPWVLMVMIAANAVTTTLQCGLGACPDNPTVYEWLPWRSGRL